MIQTMSECQTTIHYFSLFWNVIWMHRLMNVSRSFGTIQSFPERGCFAHECNTTYVEPFERPSFLFPRVFWNANSHGLGSKLWFSTFTSSNYWIKEAISECRIPLLFSTVPAHCVHLMINTWSFYTCSEHWLAFEVQLIHLSGGKECKSYFFHCLGAFQVASLILFATIVICQHLIKGSKRPWRGTAWLLYNSQWRLGLRTAFPILQAFLHHTETGQCSMVQVWILALEYFLNEDRNFKVVSLLLNLIAFIFAFLVL